MSIPKPIQELLTDESVSTIIVSGPKHIYAEVADIANLTDIKYKDNAQVIEVINKIISPLGKKIDADSPNITGLKIEKNLVLNAAIPPVFPRPVFTIHKASFKSNNENKILLANNSNDDLSRSSTSGDFQNFYSNPRLVEIQKKVIADLDTAFIQNLDDIPGTKKYIESLLGTISEKGHFTLTNREKTLIIESLLNEFNGLGPLQELLADDSISEIMVNGYDQIYVEKKGVLELTKIKFRDNEHVIQIIHKIVSPLGRRIDESSPMVDARLQDGSRVNAVIPPVSLTGPALTIRKFNAKPLEIKDLIAFGSIDEEMAHFFESAIKAKANIIVAGGTGSGKTVLLNVLSSFIPSGERIITIEDAAELKLLQPHVISLESRPPNIEGRGEITIRELVKNSLRMRPNRIVIGEVRGAEALDMLQAMNTGHSGSMSTVHANSPRDALSRLETMVLYTGIELPLHAIREQICAAIDLVIYVERLSDGSRRVTKVTEVMGLEGDIFVLQDLYYFKKKGEAKGKVVGAFNNTSIRPRIKDKFNSNTEDERG